VKLKKIGYKRVANFTQEEFDTFENTLTKTIDYLSNRVWWDSKVEIGAIINQDEFDWKFKSK
jgi:hypothetical protein